MSRGDLAQQIELLAQHLREDPEPSDELGYALVELCREWDGEQR